nr:DUF6777 domain-containing protein [Streptomyces alanosinicus]
MSAEPPSSGRPTGPPSGPLSGSSRPPSGPPPGRPLGGAGSPGPHGPWWKSVPRVSALAAAVVAAVVLAVVFTRPGGGSAAKGEVFLQSASSSGQDPFTESTAKQSSAPPPPAASAAATGTANAVQGVQGGAPGLYSGTQRTPACDIERQIKAFQADPGTNKAFASVAGVQPSGVPAYLRSLTPVQLRVDTRVTNHGYRGGTATAYQSVLQAGTAVLVDSHGVPRVRCACGNPLTPPVAQKTTPKLVGPRWSAYRPSNVVVVTPAPAIVNIFVLYDPHHDDWIHRHRGDQDCRHDQHGKPPEHPHPWNPPTPSTSGKPSPSASTSSSSSPSSSSSSSPSSPSSSSSSSSSPSSSSSSSSSSSPPSSSSQSSSAPSESTSSSSPSESKSSEPPSSGSTSPGSQSQSQSSQSSQSQSQSQSRSASTAPSSAGPASSSAGPPSSENDTGGVTEEPQGSPST